MWDSRRTKNEEALQQKQGGPDGSAILWHQAWGEESLNGNGTVGTKAKSHTISKAQRANAIQPDVMKQKEEIKIQINPHNCP